MSTKVDTSATPAITHAMAEPAKPSQDFFGLTLGAMGCLPNMTAAAYPPTSLHTVVAMNAVTRAAPCGWSVSSAAKPARNGTYVATNTLDVMSRSTPCRPSGTRHTTHARTVAIRPKTSASLPRRYAAMIISGPPTASGTTVGRRPAEPSARQISTIATVSTPATTTAKTQRTV